MKSLVVLIALLIPVACSSSGGSGGGGSGGGGAGGSGGATGSAGCARSPAGDSACSSYSNSTFPQAWACPNDDLALGKMMASNCESVTFGPGPSPLCCAAN